MFDRSSFWSATPEWRGARLSGTGVAVAAVRPKSIWRISGRIPLALPALGLTRTLGPREVCDAPRYALRLAPDSVLVVSIDSQIEPGPLREAGSDVFCSELTDGITCIDLEGPAVNRVLTRGCEYPFGAIATMTEVDAVDSRAEESARLLFAGLRVAVLRSSGSWRLHIEQPWAPALWQWLSAHID